MQKSSVSIQSEVRLTTVMDKDNLLSLLGTMPKKVELNLKVTEEVDCGAFIRKKISYSAEAGEIIYEFLEHHLN